MDNVLYSLSLALLHFKPAPVYILDEVDVALDLAHRQNIEQMIRKYFPESRFIIVSLKESMFTNANVLFRTRFLNGMSTVIREDHFKILELSSEDEDFQKIKGFFFLDSREKNREIGDLSEVEADSDIERLIVEEMMLII